MNKIQKVRFTKMHGLGNDFIIINKIDINRHIDITKFVKEISQYHTAIGCDQFVLYEILNDNNVKNTHVHARMSIYNKDGSKAEACGNASRCITRILFDKHQKHKIIIDIDGRDLKCEYISQNLISVNMGRALFEAKWMPKNEKLWEFAIKYDIEPKELLCVDVGNPHIVIFNDKLNKQEYKLIGQKLQNTDLFKNGVNVNFATINQDGNIFLKIWERGVGFTLACGSGACASFIAANKLGFVKDHSKVYFELGSLEMQKRSNEHGDEIIIRGPAKYVCTGDYYYDVNISS